ncbi:MAG: hypothetical protein KOO65_11820 [Desulfobacterales bacterium]|nr:hypothetical protein [Desulfobacterales bacterium]
MKYTLLYNDGIVYESPDIRSKDPGWASEDGAKLVGIRQMSIKLPNDQILILKGFEKYNFFVEASQGFGKNNARIESFFFCGAWQGHVVSWEINYRTEQILKRMAKEGHEYNGTATRGWRMGLIGEKAESGLCPLQ